MAASSGGESRVDRQKIDRLVQLLAEERHLSSTEIADTLWLALTIEPEPSQPQSTPDNQSQNEQPQPVQNIQSPEAETDEENVEPFEHPQESQGTLSATEPQASKLPSQALPVWIADPAMLKDPLVIMRALKPLLRQVEVGVSNKLDENATVESVARTKLWLPVLKAQTEPWFDAVLVVDRSTSMHLWRRLAEDLERILRRYGAFRDLQVYNLQVSEDAANIDGASGEGSQDKAYSVKLISHSERPGHHPTELIEQQGRRIIILLSDCAATYWWDGKLVEVIESWAQVMPTVVWQMLPPWMWERTALGRGKAISACNSIPGASNQQLLSQPVDKETGTERRLDYFPLPVVTSDPDDLRNWAAMLSGDFRELTPGYLLPQNQGPVPKSRPISEIAEDILISRGEQIDDEESLDEVLEEIAKERIERFLDLASPAARRLIMLLTAAPVITLPVMRLIRDSMVPSDEEDGRSPLPVAEVFLSGLLQQLEAEVDSTHAGEDGVSEAVQQDTALLPEQTIDDVSNPHLIENTAVDLIQYDFIPKGRKLLLNVLPKVDTLEVITSVTAAVEERWNRFSTQSFRAFLLDPQVEEPLELAGIRSFASMTAEILQPLGGQYTRFAEQLRQTTTVANSLRPFPAVAAEFHPNSDRNLARETLHDLNLGSDSAERDIDVGLAEYFYQTNTYNRFVNGRKTILVGSRGAGKSAILKYIATTERKKGNLVIELSPEEYSYELLSESLRSEKNGSWGKQSAYSVSWQYLLYNLIFKKIAKNKRGLLLGAQRDIYNYVNGSDIAREISSIGIFLNYIERIERVKAESSTDGVSSALQALYALEEIKALLPSLKNVLRETRITVLVDELDTGWDNSEDARYFIAGLFQAIQKINSLHQNLRVYASIRESLFGSIPQIYEDAQRIREDVEVIRWGKNELLELIALRIVHSFPEITKLPTLKRWKTIFVPRISSSGVDSFDYIIERTQLRPRELLQFCKLCVECVEYSQVAKRIDEHAIYVAEGLYSEQKTRDLAAEYRFQYPFLLDIFEVFRRRSAYYTKEELEYLLLSIVVGEIDVERATSWALGLDYLELKKILWEIGFLQSFIPENIDSPEYRGRYKGNYEIPTINIESIEKFRIHPACVRFLNLSNSP